MPIVTAIEMHQRKKERVKLFLDDEYAMDLPLLRAAILRPGQQLTQAEVDALADDDAAQTAYEMAVRFLSYRPRSADEVRRYLARKAVPDSLQQEVIERLERLGYVDDVAFAEFWLADRERFKPMAPRALRYELRQKGVADHIIDAQLSDVNASASAFRAASKRVHRFRGSTRQQFREKLSGFLRRRGFAGDVIIDVVRQMQRELAETDSEYFRVAATE